jgi:beta-glucosidase
VSERTFPVGFLWGVAGAGHQTEGDNTNSDTWFAELVTPTVFMEPSGKACNSYELWREDVALAEAMGLSAYRFSVEWARVEPEEGSFDDRELEHYEAIVDECLARGLAPIVTYNHFTSPHWFAMHGSWLGPAAPELFARYCAKVTERFGDRTAYAVTMNEPNLTRLLSWLELPDFIRAAERATLEAASEKAGVERYRLANVMLPEEMDAFAGGMTAGHVAAREAIKAQRPDLPVGLSLAVMDDVVDGDDPSVRDRKRAEVYELWLELARDDDFIGVQNYERIPYDGHGPVPPPVGAELNQMGSVIEPLSLGGAVRYAHEATAVPVLVTEHGMSTADDRQRAAFIEPSLAGLLDVMDDGVPVLGYCHWTLLDNFEWVFGYGHQLGLHEVDRETFERTPKPSAGVYTAIAKAHAVGRAPTAPARPARDPLRRRRTRCPRDRA